MIHFSFLVLDPMYTNPRPLKNMIKEAMIHNELNIFPFLSIVNSIPLTILYHFDYFLIFVFNLWSCFQFIKSLILFFMILIIHCFLDYKSLICQWQCGWLWI